MSRPLPHVYRLSRPAIGNCTYAKASQDLLSSHISEERFVYLVQNESFFYIKKDIPDERNALNRTDNTPCQKLAAKIKAFQSAFQVRDLAANGMCSQVTLLT